MQDFVVWWDFQSLENGPWVLTSSSSFLVEQTSSTRTCHLTLFGAVRLTTFQWDVSYPTLPFSYVARCAGVFLSFASLWVPLQYPLTTCPSGGRWVLRSNSFEDTVRNKIHVECRRILNMTQGETKVKRRGCPSGKLLLEVTSMKVWGASLKLNCS